MYLGLDLGTSGLRGLLVTDGGQPIGAAEAHYDVTHDHAGWSEQDPQDWITALGAVMDQLRADHPKAFADIQAMAVAGHMHGAVLLDSNQNVLRPCILWNDTRSHAEAAELDTTDQVRDLSGNIVFPGFTAPKLKWVAAHEPDIFAKTDLVLLPKDYVNLWLTGQARAEVSDAAGSSWLDNARRDWSDRLLDASGMKPSQMAELVEGSGIAGTLRPELAAKWGLPANTVIAGGAADNAAAACGVGALNDGDGFVSLGTSGVLLAARNDFAPKPETAVHTFCHAIPNRWYQMGVILAATDSLNWLSRQLGQGAAELSSALGDTISAPGQTQFLPYLSGERTPHNDSAIRGAFLHLDISNGPQDLTRAVMEGVAFALRDAAEALEETGAQLDRLLAIGGGSQSPYWVELCATVLNKPIDLPAKGEFGAAMGAARLAQCAQTGANPNTIMTKPDIAQTVIPRAELVAEYDAAYAKWRAAYPILKDLP